ncbi:MAG: flagellar hook-basal body complex protein [Rickettsiales bacterium]
MSLYGALFGGVSGLQAQSSKIGAISDNIANVNTIGYKQANSTFQSLVVNTSSSVSYQTGGVRGGTRLAVSQQGLLSSTQSNTDLAISGGGFFVVRSQANAAVGSTGLTPFYTRAGSFNPDALGNFVNTQGYFLQAWPLDRDGRLPGEPGNLNTVSSSNFDSLKTVNVQSASGVAQSTTTISLGANLNAGEVVYPGEAQTLRPDLQNSNNLNLAADKILVSSEYGLAGVDSTRRGDRFTVSTGNGLSYTYEYGGYTVGRDVSNSVASTNIGDGQTNNKLLNSLAAPASFTADGVSSGFFINIGNHGLINGDKVNLSGFVGVFGGVPAASINGQQTVTVVNANTLFFATGSVPAAGSYGGGAQAANLRQYAGSILDANSATQTFLGQLGTTGFTAGARTLSITSATAGTKTFTYTTSSPNTLSGQFNNLNTLAAAIDSVNGLTARVVNNRLVVGAEDASESIAITNGDAVGTTTSRGIDWKGELGLADIAGTTRRYSNLQGLASLVNADTGLSAKVSNPLSSSTIAINVDDPLDTIQFQDLTDPNFSIAAGPNVSFTAGAYAAGASVDIVITDAAQPATLNVGDFVYLSGLNNGTAGLPGTLPNGGPFQVIAQTPGNYTVRLTTPVAVNIVGGPAAVPAGVVVSIANESNQGSQLAQLGIVPSLNSALYTPQNSGVLGPQYDPTGQVGQNLASGDITAQFSRNVRIYDSLGSGHDLRFSYIKIAQNSWAVEVHAIPTTDVNTALADGQVAVGTIDFNGDGTLRSVSSALTNPVIINWTNGAVASSVSLDLGTAGQPFGTVGAATIGLSDGLSQFDSAYNVNFANQNGAPVGQLVSVAIDGQGILTASYSNGQTQRLFQLPLADFANPDGLDARSGNVYTQSQASGEVNLRVAGNNGVGTLVAAALEQSNVDLAAQLTDLIVAQRAYQANTKVIKTADELLDQLNNI